MQAPPPVPVLLERLQGLATAVAASLTAVGIDWLWRPAPSEWSLTEVICHLRDVEREVHQVRFRAVLERENPFLAGVSSNEWAEPRQYRLQDGPAALQSFLQHRATTVALLAQLRDTDWQRKGSHSYFGPTSMHELLNLVVKHDQAHWEQIDSLLHRKVVKG
ncbi:MAG: DinB family protein [Anaerolinea sp.]|nr:DinB family protein [Anaerolinea sp.]